MTINDFSELDNKPRIILAAGAFDDTEITATALWLRSQGVDISCVEIKPYRMNNGHIVLVPRVLIPLPAESEYIVGIQKKAAAREKSKFINETDLTKIAEERKVMELTIVCREIKDIWKENLASVYGGSFVYSLVTEQGWRSLFGINVSGDRQSSPAGELDVWVPIKNLAEVTGHDATVIRDTLSAYHPNWQEAKDFVFRLVDIRQARALVQQLRSWGGSRNAA